MTNDHREGRRALILTASAAVLGAGCSDAGKPTKENHAKVTDGMTEAEVLELLGDPDSRGGDIDANAVDASVSTWVWGSGARRLTVTFKGGKVLGKTP